MNKVKILVVQYKIKYLHIKSNLLKFERVLNQYKYLNPDLVIFPEYALTGPLFSNYHLALRENSVVINNLSSLAQKYQTYLVPGSFIRNMNKTMYNSTCLIDKKGKIIGFYDKKNLWSSEKRYLKKGVDNFIYQTPVGTIALQICADLNSPFNTRSYNSLKPDIIINVAMWSQEDINACNKYVPSNIELIQTEVLAKARAIENRCFMIFCNYAGNIKVRAKTGRRYNETSIGNSMIINPYGEIISKSSTNKEEILFAQIDLSKCHWFKYIYT